jgi:protein-disulfide isomerase
MRIPGAALSAAVVLLFAGAASAQSFLNEPINPPSQKNPIAARAAEMAPVLSWLQTQGVKLTYLGDEGGLKAYLGESANGKQQVFYATPDGDHVVAGLLFKRDGMNVTGVQIGEMQQRFREAQQKYDEAMKTSHEPSEEMKRQLRQGSEVIPSTGAKTAEPASKAAPEKAVDAKPADKPAEKALPERRSEAAPSLPAALAQATTQPAAPPTQPVAPAVSPIKQMPVRYLSGLDKAEFERSVEDLAWFRVGEEKAPALYMVADPNCRFCHKAWDDLKPMVLSGKLQLRIIMVAGLPGSDAAARAILSSDLPGQEWIAGRGSVDGIQAGPAPEPNSEKWNMTTRVLQGNADFIKRFSIQQTPFFGFVGRDGNLYSSTGVPSDLALFLSTLI